MQGDIHRCFGENEASLKGLPFPAQYGVTIWHWALQSAVITVGYSEMSEALCKAEDGGVTQESRGKREWKKKSKPETNEDYTVMLVTSFWPLD